MVGVPRNSDAPFLTFLEEGGGVFDAIGRLRNQIKCASQGLGCYTDNTCLH